LSKYFSHTQGKLSSDIQTSILWRPTKNGVGEYARWSDIIDDGTLMEFLEPIDGYRRKLSGYIYTVRIRGKNVVIVFRDKNEVRSSNCHYTKLARINDCR
jgi:hypothetical protein